MSEFAMPVPPNPRARPPSMGPLLGTVSRESGMRDDARNFRRTELQTEAAHLLNTVPHVMLFGGSGSGKTFAIVHQIFTRAIQKTSRHLIIRHCLNAAKQSLVHLTIPQVLEACFPSLSGKVVWHGQDSFYTIPNLEGGESTLWIAGSDSKERVEKILGTEFSTIYIEEASQVPYEAVTKLQTRLREESGMSKRLFYAMNPSGTNHWAHQMFIKHLLPTGEPWTREHASLLMNPESNLENLSEDYLEELAALPKRERQRFLEGKWLNDIEGAIWTDQDIVNAKAKEPGSIMRTVIAVDPAVSNTSGSDECGIIVCSVDENGDGVIEADYSGKMATTAWAKQAVKAWHEFDANEIVIETNQGGDLCVDAIKNVPGGSGIKVVKVHAARGKQARAEPVQALYEQKKIAHLEGLSDLEDELANWVPTGTTASPNRLDACVWGVTHLMLRNTRKRIHIGGAR